MSGRTLLFTKNIYIHITDIKINESLRVVHFLAREGKTYEIKQ